MGGSIFISMSKVVELAFKNACFPDLHKFETEIQELWSEEEAEEYGSHAGDALLWLGLESFLLGKETSINIRNALPYVHGLGIKGAYPLAQQLKAKVRNSLENLRGKDFSVKIPKLGKDLQKDLPKEFLHCEYIEEFQQLFARVFFLAALKSAYEENGEVFPEEFIQARKEALAKMELADTEFLFRAKSHFSFRPCGDCKENFGKILPMNGGA